MKRQNDGNSVAKKSKKLAASNEPKVEETSVKSKTLKKEKGVERKGKFQKPLSKNNNSASPLKASKEQAKEYIKKSIHNSNAITEKPDWLKFKKEKKELKEKRKAQRLTDAYDIAVKAKKVWEKLRRSDCPADERRKLTAQLHELLKGKYEKMILSHDTSRIIQWVVKYCDDQTKQVILEELKPSLLLIFQSKYGKNSIRILLKYGSRKIKDIIITACYGNVIKLMSHTVSASLIELAYSEHSTEINKIHFKQEFYGDMYKEAKDENVKCLSDVFHAAADMKSATLSAVKMNLNKILNKKFVSSLLVQTLLYEFLENCSVEDRAEMICTLRESIVTLSRTKIGAKVATMCVWHGTNKDRKIMLKALKGSIKDIAISEHGYLLLLALFDSVDDTVLMKKIVLSEVENDLLEISLNEHGKHVVLYLVARRDPHYFPPSLVEYLQQGDNNSASKKAADIREKELREAVIDVLLQSISKETIRWLSNAAVSMVTLAVLKAGAGEKLKLAFTSIATHITNTELKIKENDTEHNIIENAGIHMMLKKLIQHDKTLLEKSESTFGEVIVAQLTADTLENWLQYNRGCFILISLLENESVEITKSLLSKLKPLVKKLKSKSSPGASILLQKIK